MCERVRSPVYVECDAQSSEMSGQCYTCRHPFTKERHAVDAPCDRREHATHEGMCYSYAHCAATLDGEAPVCGACGTESDSLRGSFLSLPPGLEEDGGTEASFALVGWASGDPGMAAVTEMLAQLPPVVELPAHTGVLTDTRIDAEAVPPGPTKARTFINNAIGRARTGGSAAGHEEVARGASMLRLEEAAGRWQTTTFADPHIALAGRGQRAGEGLLRPEILVAARIGLDDIARAGRLTANELPLFAPTWGDLRALGIATHHLIVHRRGGLAPALLVRQYRINAAMLCADVIPEGVAGLARIGYSPVELRVLGVSAPWLLSGAGGANNNVARLAQFRRSGDNERPIALSEWRAYLQLTPALITATRDYSEERLMQVWEPNDVRGFLAEQPPPVVFGLSPGNAMRSSGAAFL